MAKDVFDTDIASRLNIYRINPRNLKPDPILNGRVSLPGVEKFKADFRNPMIGQTNTILIKKVDGEPIIVDGVTRWRAALELTEAGEGPHEGGVFFLKAQYFVAKSPVDYFIATIAANIRNEPKPEDDANNIAILVHNFGIEDLGDIASRIYGRFCDDGKPDIKWVKDRLALHELTPKGLEALRSGKLTTKAAVALSRQTEKVQREKLALLDGGHKLTVAAIKRTDAVPTGKSTAEAPPAPPAKRKGSKDTACEVLQRYCDMVLPQHISAMTADNAVREVIGQIIDELECGQ